jgi:hypothetical protein
VSAPDEEKTDVRLCFFDLISPADKSRPVAINKAGEVYD